MSMLTAGRNVLLSELKALAVKAKNRLEEAARSAGREIIIYLHWSAGHYHQFYTDYHINIDDDGSAYVTTDDLTEVKAHTWHRNTGALGIALACCAFATPNDLGKEPPTDLQIESMAQIVAVLSSTLGINIDAEHIMTHAEAANLDIYGPDTTWERWDLWFLHNGDDFGTGGNILRGKAIWYQQNNAGV